MLRSRPDSTTTLLADPFRMHEILIATYFDNWRWYLREMADMFKSDVGNSCLSSVPTLIELSLPSPMKSSLPTFT